MCGASVANERFKVLHVLAGFACTHSCARLMRAIRSDFIQYDILSNSSQWISGPAALDSNPLVSITAGHCRWIKNGVWNACLWLRGLGGSQRWFVVRLNLRQCVTEYGTRLLILSDPPSSFPL